MDASFHIMRFPVHEINTEEVGLFMKFYSLFNLPHGIEQESFTFPVVGFNLLFVNSERQYD